MAIRAEVRGPIISVIIPTWREDESTLRSCLTSLFMQSLPKSLYEVIIVNYSPCEDQGLRRLTEEFKEGGLRVKLVTINEEGIGKARNLGVRASSRSVKYLVFMGADDKLSKGLLEATLKLYVSNPYLVAIRYRVRPVIRRLKGVRWALVRLLEEVNMNLIPMLLINLFKQYYLPGWLFSCRRKAFEAVGGFSEDYNVGEDTELGLKLGRCRIVSVKGDEPVLSKDDEGVRPLVAFVGSRYWGEVGSKGLWLGVMGCLACYVTYWAEEVRRRILGRRVWRVRTVRL